MSEDEGLVPCKEYSTLNIPALTGSVMNWEKAKKHFDSVRKQYQDMEGMPVVNTSMALRLTFDPLARRYNSGERTAELYDEMNAVR